MNLDDLIARMVEEPTAEPDVEEAAPQEAEPTETSANPPEPAETSEDVAEPQEAPEESLEAPEDVEAADADLPVEEPENAADESLSLEEPSSEDDVIEQDVSPSEMPAEMPAEITVDEFVNGYSGDTEMQLSDDVQVVDDPLESPAADEEVSDERLNIESPNQPSDRVLGFDKLESGSAPESYRDQASRMVEVKLPDGWEGDISNTIQQRMRETQEVVNSHLDDELGSALYHLDMMGGD